MDHLAAQRVKEVGDTSTQLVPSVTGIINAIIAVLGIAAVVVMIIGGVNYMTSAGDTSKVEKAKKTILYGLIGLIICVLAFAITNWVIGMVNNQISCREGETYVNGQCTSVCQNGYTWNSEEQACTKRN